MLKVYLDTSVISALFDKRNPERQLLTERFWDNINEFNVFVSELTFLEITRTIKPKLRKSLLNKAVGFTELKLNEAIEQLAEKYIECGAIPVNEKVDALHIATAVINSIDYLLSWNFSHIVRDKTRNLVNLTN